jgi:hypothetical protein
MGLASSVRSMYASTPKSLKKQQLYWWRRGESNSLQVLKTRKLLILISYSTNRIHTFKNCGRNLGTAGWKLNPARLPVPPARRRFHGSTARATLK